MLYVIYIYILGLFISGFQLRMKRSCIYISASLISKIVKILQPSSNGVHRNKNAIVITVLYKMNYNYIKNRVISLYIRSSIQYFIYYNEDRIEN